MTPSAVVLQLRHEQASAIREFLTLIPMEGI